MKTRTRRIWKTIAVIASVIAVVYAGLTIWSVVALHRAYAALERDGRPMKLADVMPPPIPESDNAAPLYEKALKILNTEKIGDQTLMERLRKETDGLRDTNMTSVAFNGFRDAIKTPAAGDAMRLIVQAGLRKNCRFSWINAQTNHMERIQDCVPHFGELTRLSRVVAWEARRLAVDSDAANARLIALAEMRLAQASIGGPGLINHMMMIAQRERALYTLKVVCTREFPSKNEAAVLMSELARFDDPELFAKGMVGDRLLEDDERFFRLEWLHSVAPFQRQNLGVLMGMNRLAARAYLSRWNPIFRLDHAAYIHAVRRPATALLGDRSAEGATSAWLPYTRMTLESHSAIRDSFTAHLARVRCTEAGLAVLVYKKEHGVWPETLGACMDKVPVDPFDGKPLRYRLTDKGFVVSSVGKVGKPQKEIAWDCMPANL